MRCEIARFLIRGCPRNCKRRAEAENHWDVPGKAATQGDDPRARRPAVSRGHARARWAGCPDGCRTECLDKAGGRLRSR